MSDLFALALTLIIHEAGHVIASLLCGASVSGIRTRVGGLSLLCRADSLSYPNAAVVYAGGAIANLFFAAVFFHFSKFAAYSVGAAVFNLLPLPGSDGVMLLSSLLSAAVESPDSVERVVGVVSDAAVFLFWIFAVYLSVVGKGDIMLLAFAVVLVVYRLGEREK